MNDSGHMSRTQAVSPTIDSPLSAAPVEDMIDSAASLIDLPESLRGAVAQCLRLHELYRLADREALRQQRYHRLLTIITVCCGTIAVLFAIIQLSDLVHFHWLREAELVAALLALAAVVLGMIASRRPRWLLQRHKAERCRLLKFRFLIDPHLWCGAEARAKRMAEFQEEVDRLARLTAKDLHCWVEQDEVPEPPTGSVPKDAADEIRALVEYYRRKRLAVQIDYFERRVRRNLRADRPIKHLPAVFFFASVLAAAAHFGYDVATNDRGSHSFSVALIVLAASLPVLGSGVRTLRMSHEFARNTSRYRAKLVVLRRLAETLAAETDPAMIGRELWCGEQVLESEHREWLRLMVEAEWFG